MTEKKYRVAIAGSTEHTVTCAKALQNDHRFEVKWVLTPTPKLLGRKQQLTKNPPHMWGEAQNLPIISIETKINETVKEQVTALDPIDFLLVVDFGYIVPKWLLAHPQIAPLNIHPSLLPRWRGSSPGQFVLLHHEKTSAVTLMVMNAGLDTGDIIFQQPFDVQDEWNQTDYYHFAFAIFESLLPQKMVELAEHHILPTPQPELSPTPVARKLAKDDGFLDWQIILHATKNAPEASSETTNPLLQSLYIEKQNWAEVIDRATHGLAPWPGLWTLVPTVHGQKRMKILEVKITPGSSKIELITVQIEGLQAHPWKQVQNQVIEK